MPTPAQQAAARTNGARRSMDALSFHPLAKTTVLKNESHKGFQELVCHHTLRIAPRRRRGNLLSHPVFAGGLECLVRACDVLAGKNPRLQAPRPPGERNSRKLPPRNTPRVSRPVRRPAGRTVRRSLYPCASGHSSPSHGRRPVNPKNPASATPRKPKRNPRRTHGNPRTSRHPRRPAASSGSCVPANTPGRSGGVR